MDTLTKTTGEDMQARAQEIAQKRGNGMTKKFRTSQSNGQISFQVTHPKKLLPGLQNVSASFQPRKWLLENCKRRKKRLRVARLFLLRQWAKRE